MPPLIGITFGEPRGIGPEVLVKALSIDEIDELCRPVIFGQKSVFKQAMDQFGLDRELVTVKKEDLSGTFLTEMSERKSFLFDTTDEFPETSTLKAIRLCAEFCQKGLLSAMVTGPVDKHRLNKFCTMDTPFTGHTDFLAEITGASRVAMMLAGENLKVVPVTTHCPLREVSDRISIRTIVDAVELTNLAMKEWFGVPEPRIAVTALNPHAGERGMLGSEEEDIILPAVEKCRLNGMETRGPLPADTLFYQAVNEKKFDAVVTMYHDQALIPLKLLDFHTAVNITLGLPIVRTAVDHGTAYDLVGKKAADPRSMIEAICTAARLCRGVKTLVR